MQALILAAGFGKRLGELSRTSTKCMLTINGYRLIEYMLDTLLEVNIASIVMVIGHGGKEVQSFLGNIYKGIPIKYVINNNYHKSNNIYSVYLAREFLKNDDILLLESDLIFDKSIISDCINSTAENLAVVAKHKAWMDGTVVTLDNEDFISEFIPKMSFDWSKSNKYFKTVNIYKLSQNFCSNVFLPLLHSHINSVGVNDYYEEVFRIALSVKSQQFRGLSVGNRLWYEIDTIQDLETARALFANNEYKLSLSHECYSLAKSCNKKSRTIRQPKTQTINI